MIFFYYLKIFFIICLFHRIKSWNSSNILINFTSLIQKTDLRDQLVQKATLNNQSYLIIFGGKSYNQSTGQYTLLNGLYKINLKTRQTSEVSLNKIVKPSPRYGVCGNIVRDRLFIYGGYTESGLISNQIWQYGFLTDQWSLRGKSLLFKNCQIMIISHTYTNDTISIIGVLVNDSSFKIVQYNIFTQTINEKTNVEIFNSVQMSTKLWDGTEQITYLRIQTVQDLISSNFTANPEVQFNVKYFCIKPYMDNIYVLVTNNGLYFISKISNTYKINYWDEHNQQQNEKIDCAFINQWYFFIQTISQADSSVQYDIFLEYYYAPTWTGGTLHKNKKNIYINWLGPVQFFASFGYDQSIFIINQQLNVFYLNQTCDKSMSVNSNVKMCAFGMFSCYEGFTGSKCSLKQCGGSLRLYDLNNLTEVEIQCSGNGQCTQRGCNCTQNWAGQSCQIYQKIGCKQTLIQNFIASNCQCNIPTIGGNQCDVVFCYNDCSGKGTCLQTGECKCQDQYTGPDCSILTITFDILN